MINLRLCRNRKIVVLVKIRAYERVMTRSPIPITASICYGDVAGEIALGTGFQTYLRTPIMATSLYTTPCQFV